MKKTSKKGSSTDFLVKVICNIGMRNYNQISILFSILAAVSLNRASIKNLIPFSTIYQKICLFLPLGTFIVGKRESTQPLFGRLNIK